MDYQGGIMNDLHYKALNYLYQKSGHTTLNVKTLCDEQYEGFTEHSIKAIGKPMALKKEEFDAIITEINEVLKLYLTARECNVAITHYLIKLLEDCILSKQDIDLSWSLDKLYYLAGATFMEKRISGEVISYIQDRLYKKFEIDETLASKTIRKIKTKASSKALS